MWTATEWAAFGTVLYGFGTVGAAVAVGAATIVGSSSFNSWRKQKISERRSEQAERILTATYKVRRGLATVRNPMLWAYEQIAAEKELEEEDKLTGSDEEKQRKRIARVYFNRIDAQFNNRMALEDCQPMARALFGEALEGAIQTLNVQFNIVASYANTQSQLARDVADDVRDEIRMNLEMGIPTTEQNKMDQLVADLVGIIERICVPALRLESTGSTKP